MTRRGLLALALLSVVALLGLTACGDSSGGKPRSIKVVIAEYSKDHTRPFWQGLSDQYTKQTGVKVELQVIDWNSIDQQVSTRVLVSLDPFVRWRFADVTRPTGRASLQRSHLRRGEGGYPKHDGVGGSVRHRTFGVRWLLCIA